MGDTLSWSGILALAATLLVGAALPSLSSLLVVARSAGSGRAQGIAVAAGIVSGDLLFILIALYGLVWVAGILDGSMFWMKIVGAVWLAWLGVRLLRAPAGRIPADRPQSAAASYLSGLLVTLADQKAILFYLGFLPSFVEITRVTVPDTLVILSVATVCVFVPKLIYALAADRVVDDSRSSILWLRRLNVLAGLVLLSVAAAVLLHR